MDNEAQSPTITIDNLVYSLNSMPQAIKDMIAVQQAWSVELEAKRQEVARVQTEGQKLVFAINGINGELVNMVRKSGVPPIKDLNSKPEAEVVPAGETAPGAA